MIPLMASDPYKAAPCGPRMTSIRSMLRGSSSVTSEGESTWYEGFQLLMTYVVIALAFYFA